MSTKHKVIFTLLMNIPVAGSIALVAQLLAIHTVKVDLFLINFALAYVISFLVGVFIPAAKWGVGFAMKCKAQPDSLKFGLLVNVIVNFVYVLVNEICLTYFNVIILGHAPIIAFVMGMVTTFVPIYAVGYVVSFLWNRPADNIAKAICKE